MRNHTTPKIFELVSAGGGKSPTMTPGASAQTATFLLNNIPTGKLGKFWYYATAAVLRLKFVVDQPTGGGSAIDHDKLWKVLQSVSVNTPILGNLFTHQNTRGSVLGTLIQRLGFGYNALPARAQIASSDGDTSVVLYYRIPFAYEFLRKPHETSPWGGFLEGGQIEVKLDVSTVLGSDSTGCVIKATTDATCWLEMIPAPEPVIHTPCHWREHILPGGTTRHTIVDIGAPDGLNGINQSKGVGLASMWYLTDATGIGLSGADGTDNIIGYDIPWRDQDRIDNPDAAMMALLAHAGVIRSSKVPTHDGGGWPYTIAATPNGVLNDAQALVFPFVAPGRDCETSKLQTISGAKDINVSYTSTPSGACRLVGHYFPQFDDQFVQGLAARIAPGYTGKLVPKTLNKQAGMVHGVGKMAYVRQKIE